MATATRVLPAVAAVTELVRRALVLEAEALGIKLGRPIPDPTVRWTDDVIECVNAHQVTSLIARWSDEVRLPAEAQESLQERAMADASAAATLALETGRACAALADDGVPVIAFKGPVLSVLTTGAVTTRGNGDVDLLVPPDYVTRAVASLTRVGWTLADLNPRQLADWWPWLERGGREVTLDASLTSIDLHWRIAWQPGLLPPVELMMARGRPVDLLGTSVRTLGEDDTLVAASYHLRLDRYRSLRHMVDLIRILRNRSVPLRVPDRAGRLVAEAANFCSELLGGLPPGHLAGLGIRDAPTERAWRQWLRYSGDPAHLPVPPHPLLKLNEVRQDAGTLRFPIHLTRVGVQRILRTPALQPTSDGPISPVEMATLLVRSSSGLVRPHS